MSHIIQILIVSATTAIIAFLIGVSTPKINSSPPPTTVQATSILDQYPLLSRRISVIDSKDRIIHLVPLRKELQEYNATRSETIGVYFEYIPSGVSLNINGNTPFTFASLLKVPIVMAIYAKKNAGKISLNDTIKITKDMIDTNYGDLGKKGEGIDISIKDAINLSLKESDNTAHQLLRLQLTPQELGDVFLSIDIPLDIENNSAVVTPKNYTSILRSLFLSSYLPLEDSQEILSILSKSLFNDGIRKTIPENITIAHKMGIRNETNTLSDCGIIYIPNRPYFLCIMIKSETAEDKTPILQTISEKIYKYISSQ